MTIQLTIFLQASIVRVFNLLSSLKTKFKTYLKLHDQVELIVKNTEESSMFASNNTQFYNLRKLKNIMNKDISSF